MKKLIILLFAIAGACSNERSDEELMARPYATAQTLPVTEITVQGAVFNGSFDLQPEGVTNVGFTWGNELRMLGTPTGNTFSTSVTSTLLEGVPYSVRAIVVSNGYTVYGAPFTFTSLGSRGPVITDFNPKKAKIGETVTIVGAGFSNSAYNNIVKFGSTEASVLSNTETQISVRVPFSLTAPSYPLTVTAYFKTATATQQFELDSEAAPPTSGPGSIELVSADKSAIKLCDELTVTSVDLPQTLLNVRIYFNGVSTVPFLRSGNSLTTNVPFLPTSTTAVTIKLAVGASESTLPISLTFNGTRINSYSPLTFTPGTTITVNGLYFPLCNMSAKIGGTNVQLMNVTPTQFSFVTGVSSPFTLHLFNGANEILSYSF